MTIQIVEKNSLKRKSWKMTYLDSETKLILVLENINSKNSRNFLSLNLSQFLQFYTDFKFDQIK